MCEAEWALPLFSGDKAELAFLVHWQSNIMEVY